MTRADAEEFSFFVVGARRRRGAVGVDVRSSFVSISTRAHRSSSLLFTLTGPFFFAAQKTTSSGLVVSRPFSHDHHADPGAMAMALKLTFPSARSTNFLITGTASCRSVASEVVP